MRKTFFLLTAFAFAVSSATGADEKTNEQAPSSPIKNHWDANAWDPGSADSFWKVKKETRTEVDAIPVDTEPSK